MADVLPWLPGTQMGFAGHPTYLLLQVCSILAQFLPLFPPVVLCGHSAFPTVCFLLPPLQRHKNMKIFQGGNLIGKPAHRE